jgi:hypothetical protein
MKLDPGMHIGLHLVFFGKTGVTNTNLRDLGPTPSPNQFVTPTTNNPSTEHDNSTLNVGYYSSEARTSINLVVSCANHLI